MGVLWEDEAWQKYTDWQEQDKKTLRKINRLIKGISNGILLRVWDIRNLCRAICRDGEAAILTIRTVLYTSLPEGAQPFFRAKTITMISDWEWIGLSKFPAVKLRGVKP